MMIDIKSALASMEAEHERTRNENVRLRMENEILREGCALIREAGVQIAPVMGFSNRLCESILKVMRSSEEMQREVDRRIIDPRRTWWSETGSPMFPESKSG